jgi:hypothetical protein
LKRRLFQKKNCPTNFEEAALYSEQFYIWKVYRLARNLTNNGKKYSMEKWKEK